MTLLTSIVSLDPIYIYFDVDEATYLRNNKLWFEGKRPSSRDTANPVQVTLTGETNRRMTARWISSTIVSIFRPARCAAAR